MDFEGIEVDRFPLHCRTCLKQYKGIKHIINELATPIQLLLEQCADYETNQPYPDGICEKCYIQLESFKNFQTVCRKTKQFLDELAVFGRYVYTSDSETKDFIFNGANKNEIPLHEKHKDVAFKINTDGQESLEKVELVKISPTREAVTHERSIKCKNSKIIKCEICKKCYSSATVLKRHMLNHDKKRAFNCDICGCGFNAKCQLLRHIEKHAHLKIHCKFNCGQIFDRTYKAEKHYRQHHSVDMQSKNEIPTISSYICEVCGKSFKTKRALSDHHFSHLPEDQRPYRCEQCEKRFAQPADLRIHVMRHNGTKNFECSYCGLKKTTAREIRLHISNVHTKDRQVSCDKCSKLFLNPGCLKRHEKAVHFGQKKFKCSYCDEAFATGDTLKYHERRHTGEKPHQCTVCGHSFIQPYALKKHMNTHKNFRETL